MRARDFCTLLNDFRFDISRIFFVPLFAISCWCRTIGAFLVELAWPAHGLHSGKSYHKAFSETCLSSISGAGTRRLTNGAQQVKQSQTVGTFFDYGRSVASSNLDMATANVRAGTKWERKRPASPHIDKTDAGHNTRVTVFDFPCCSSSHFLDRCSSVGVSRCTAFIGNGASVVHSLLRYDTSWAHSRCANRRFVCSFTPPQIGVLRFLICDPASFYSAPLSLFLIWSGVPRLFSLTFDLGDTDRHLRHFHAFLKFPHSLHYSFHARGMLNALLPFISCDYDPSNAEPLPLRAVPHRISHVVARRRI